MLRKQSVVSTREILRKKWVICASLIGVMYLDSTIPEEHFSALLTHITQYRRPCTVLEIGKRSCEYLLALQPSLDIVGISLRVPGRAQRAVQEITSSSPSITQLAPPHLSCTMLETLGRCEHFDVVLVHDICGSIGESSPRLLAALANLGDALFIEPDTLEFEQLVLRNSAITLLVPRRGQQGPFFGYKRMKNILQLARFTQKDSGKVSHYTVESTFLKKEIYKEGSTKGIPWIHGLNLVSFIMMYGISPTDDHIRQQLLSLYAKNPDHTDLVLGNIIVQGTTLYPIDSDDIRRSADSRRCRVSALKSFQKGNVRLENPEAFIKSYYQSLR